MMIKTLLLVFATSVLAVGCSNGSPTQHKRDRAFFNRYINTSENFDQAEQKMSNLKVLVSAEKYNMRYALFDNGKFFYEVNNLGHGTGKWTYREGTLNLYANRTMFDIDINLMATADTGDAMQMQFLDRFGANTVKVEFRDPESAKPLPRFSRPNANSL